MHAQTGRTFHLGKTWRSNFGRTTESQRKGKERQAGPEKRHRSGILRQIFRRTMTDNTNLSKMLREIAARRATTQSNAPAMEPGATAWAHTGTETTAPPPGGGATPIPQATYHTPQGAPGFPHWNTGPTGHTMPPTGQVNPYGPPGHGQQWPQAGFPQPGFYPPHQAPQGFYHSQPQSLGGVGGLGNGMYGGPTTDGTSTGTPYQSGPPQPLGGIGGLDNGQYGGPNSARPSMSGQPQTLGGIGD